jgi:hypothetical protein
MPVEPVTGGFSVELDHAAMVLLNKVLHQTKETNLALPTHFKNLMMVPIKLLW